MDQMDIADALTAANEALALPDVILIPDDPRIELHELRTKIDSIMELVDRYGCVGGDHHKAWVLDQIMRVAKGDKGYREWLADLAAEGYVQETGIAP